MCLLSGATESGNIPVPCGAGIVVAFTLEVPEVFPAASIATTPKVYAVDAVSAETAYDVLVTVVMSVPFLYTRYPLTPTLSVDAVHARERLLWVIFDASKFVGTDGGVRSLETVTAIVADAVLPARSRACALRVCTPFVAVRVFQEAVYGAVVSSTPVATPSTKNCTPSTATLSLAEAVTFTVSATVAFATGAVILTVGSVVSGAGVPPALALISD